MRVIILHWKNKPENPFEVFSNLKLVSVHYPHYNYNTLNNYLSKSKKPFENEEVRIERVEVVNQAPVKIPGRQMLLSGRKYKMREHNEEEQNKNYWMTRTPAERLQAATRLSMQFLVKGKKMDRSRVSKKSNKQ